jgi:5-phospho-D-xylono-1,4-lactonase
MTVLGPVSYESLGITDAHNHVWIDAIPGADRSAPVLDQYDEIVNELKEYKAKGGTSLLDCQPEGCGRNGNRLLSLSKESGVNIIASTGFHRRKYYDPAHWLWNVRTQKVTDFLCSEIEQGLFETLNSPFPVKAGFIKIALEANWSELPNSALEGAAATAVKTKSLLAIHTEKGALAEKACVFFTDMGVLPSQIVLCHMDKRPDKGLQVELARFGVLLEYDTFYRTKYDPAVNLWPLIDCMVKSGCEDNVALATDMAEKEFYKSISNGPGLESLPTEIYSRLIENGYSEQVVQKLTGKNIARRLAGLN